MLGAFEPVAKPWGMDGIPEDHEFETFPEDYDHFEPVLEKAVARMPLLETAGIALFFNGPESFTPDDRYYLGEAPFVDDLFVATGFNSIGIQSSGGVGRVLADWIKDVPEPAQEYTENWVLSGDLIARILLRDQIRIESKPILEELTAHGVRSVMLTGSAPTAARSR